MPRMPCAACGTRERATKAVRHVLVDQLILDAGCWILDLDRGWGKLLAVAGGTRGSHGQYQGIKKLSKNLLEIPKGIVKEK